MPEMSLLILNRVCRMPVAVPAITPAANAAAVAMNGCTCATMRTAVTAPPSVIEPSAVMSGNSKIREADEDAQREQREDEANRVGANQQQHDAVRSGAATRRSAVRS